MKPESALRSFLALAGSSLLAMSSSHALDVANSYLTSLDVSSPTTLSVTPNFPSFLNGPLTGSSELTITGYYSGALYNSVSNPLNLINNTGNTFSGNIIIDGSSLRIAGSPFASNGGFVAGSMTSSNTITINRAGILHMDDNVSGGYTADRFGTSGDRPAVNLAGGTINLNGRNNASSSVQTFGALTSSFGQGTLNVFVNGTPSTIRPTLTFSSLAISSGSLPSFNGTNLGTGTNDARITFITAPTLNDGILAGARFYSGAPGTSEFVTYDTNGVRSFTASDYTVYGAMDINGATSTQNVQMTGAFAPVALTADTTVNSLNYNGNAGTWSLGGFKLTIASGMFLRNGNNTSPTITTGTLTAGTGSPIDLNIIIAQHTGPSISAVIADNGVSGVVTLVKSGDGRGLTLNNNTVDNSYSGGTYVVGGTLTTGSTANRRYLGTGKATVDGNSELSLGNVGATSNASGDDYTVINGGKINIASGTNGVYTSADTFKVAANSIIAGGSAAGQGLASLTRGGNATIASGAIIGHSALSAALNPTTGTIQSLGTAADLYYGLNANQNSASGSINIGSGTAFKGLSTDRQGRDWQQGTITIASGTTSVDFQGHATHGGAATLTLGNGGTAGNPVITFAGSGTVDLNARGALTLNDSTALYGDTGASQHVRFVATAGSTLTVTAATGMGSGPGIASALVNNGGSLAIGNAAALNGAVTVEAGGRLVANQAAGLTGGGTLTFNAGSIIDITNATGFSDSQATATAANLPAGTIVRLNTANPGVVGGTTLDSFLSTKSPIYQIVNDVTMANPASPDTTILTLNKDGSGVGGMLTNSFASKTFGNSTNGKITLGANGGVMAGTTGTELVVPENIDGAGTLTIGTTAIIDGAPKLGSVGLGSAANSNTYTGGTIINAGTLRQGYANVLGALTNELTVNTGGRLNMNGQALTVGNLTGTGGVISGGGATLTIGQGDNGGGNFQGSIQDPNTKLTKTGTGTITLSGANTYTGVTSINAGTLLVNGNQATASGNVTVAADATLGGTGTLGGNTNIVDNGKLQFNLSTAFGSHDGLEIASGKALTFSGASTLTITSSGGASPGLYTLVSGGNHIVGLVPATVVLPGGWTADDPVIVGNELQLNITFTGGGGSAYDTWKAVNAPSGEPADDFDGDGVSNAVEFVLGGLAATQDLGKLPKVATSGGNMTFTFLRAQSSIDAKTAVVIETSSDLATWNTAPSPYTVPDGAAAVVPGVTVVKGVPTNFDTVTLTVPQNSAKKFARLKVVIAP